MVSRRRQRQQRIVFIAIGGVFLALAVGLMLYAFEKYIVFYHGPSDVLAGDVAEGSFFRLGGVVVEGSLQRRGDTMTFAITDHKAMVLVMYKGAVPDLFREGQGVVASGRMEGGRFRAHEILAKHDENYMPREAADALRRAADL